MKDSVVVIGSLIFIFVIGFIAGRGSCDKRHMEDFLEANDEDIQVQPEELD